MSRKIALIISFLFIVLVTFGPSSFAFSESPCSVTMLNGTYGFYRTGTTPDGPLAAVGIIIYDGKGHSTVKQTVSRNGRLEAVTNDYEVHVASNCTTKTFTDGGQIVSGVIVDNGNRVFFMSRAEGVTVYGIAEKIHQH
jgi:hypothetical protein